VALGVAATCLPPAPGVAASVTARVVVKGVPFDLEVADDPQTRTAGLMFRESIDPSGGMIFAFPDEIPRTFWMRNCLVDMDLLFLDRSGRVVAMHEMQAEPLRRPHETEDIYLRRLVRYPSDVPARWAIELRAGTARKLSIRLGDQVDLHRVASPTH
jgi:uncharacterized membrane protein (UPF0127 family)